MRPFVRLPRFLHRGIVFQHERGHFLPAHHHIFHPLFPHTGVLGVHHFREGFVGNVLHLEIFFRREHISGGVETGVQKAVVQQGRLFAFVDDGCELILHQAVRGFADIRGVGAFIISKYETDDRQQRLRQHFREMAAHGLGQQVLSGQFFQKGTDAASQSDEAQHREDAENISVIREIASRVDEEGQQDGFGGQHDFSSAGQEAAGQEKTGHAKDGENGELDVAQEGVSGAQQDRQQETGDTGRFFTVIEKNIVVKIHLEQVAQGVISCKIEQHRYRGNCHASQEDEAALDAPQKLPVFDTEEKEHSHVGQMKAQKGIFYPENASGQHAVYQ